MATPNSMGPSRRKKDQNKGIYVTQNDVLVAGNGIDLSIQKGNAADYTGINRSNIPYGSESTIREVVITADLSELNTSTFALKTDLADYATVESLTAVSGMITGADADVTVSGIDGNLHLVVVGGLVTVCEIV